MAEKITLKNALANLPQKTDVDSIVATDASGNPVYIKKSDLAQVVAELIGTASESKDGLMPSLTYKTGLRTQLFLSDSNAKKIVKIGTIDNVAYKRGAIKIEGFYENESILCMISFNTSSANNINVILTNIAKPNKIEFYYKLDGGKINFYVRSTGQKGNECRVMITHYGVALSSNIGDSYDLDDTCNMINP